MLLLLLPSLSSLVTCDENKKKKRKKTKGNYEKRVFVDTKLLGWVGFNYLFFWIRGDEIENVQQ